MRRHELLLLSIGVFLTVIAWLIADVYHAATKEKVKIKIELPKIKKYTISGEVLKTLQEKTP